MNRVLLYVNGIMTFPGDSRNWNGRAVTWTHTHSEARAEKVEYFAGPVDRVFGQTARAEKLHRTLSFYRGWSISLVGHSNGADVIVDCLRQWNDWPSIEAVHLVCGATEADFNKNGLNRLLYSGRVGQACVYVADQDKALALAHTLPGRMLGYGTLGLHGAVNVSDSVKGRVTETHWPEWGHSDCWADSVFDKTMTLFM